MTTVEQVDQSGETGLRAAVPARRLLVGVCGAANAIALPTYLLNLRSDPEVEIRLVLTRSAAAIMPPSTLRLICEEVYCDGADELTTGHVALAQWAQRIVVLPATANILGQVAHGLASGLLSSTLLAAEPPVLFFPSMNLRMWERPSVRRNTAQVRADGHVVADPAQGSGWRIATRSMESDSAGLPQPAAVAAMVAEFRRADLGARTASSR